MFCEIIYVHQENATCEGHQLPEVMGGLLSLNSKYPNVDWEAGESCSTAAKHLTELFSSVPLR